MDINAEYHAAVARIDKIGGYKELAERYPKRILEIEEALEKNWTMVGVKEGEETIMRGLRKIKEAKP